ncbi:MAG: PilZ domain-containing protein [Deltaproteobacteria bacterium]|nr:PilZ domain-containing protein [Deltaproteobacteria bacterium]
MVNNRRLERFNLRLPVTIEVVSDNEDHDRKVLNLLTQNACSGGAYFHTDQPLPEGTQVKIDLVLSIDTLKKIEGKQAFIKVNGSVIRTESNGMAICFDENYSIKSV